MRPSHLTLSPQHGDLRVHVIAARDLPDMDNTFFNISRGDWTDPFVCVYLDQVQLLKTSYLENSLDPVWDEVYTLPLCHSATSFRVRLLFLLLLFILLLLLLLLLLQVKVMDREHVGAEVVGTVLIPTSDIMSGEPLEGWFDLLVSAKGDIQVLSPLPEYWSLELLVTLDLAFLIDNPCFNLQSPISP